MISPHDAKFKRDWPEWLIRVGPGASEALSAISETIGRLGQEVALGFTYEHVLQAQANRINEYLARGGPNPPKSILAANTYDYGSVPRMFVTLGFASQTAIVRLLETFHESVSRNDWLTGFVVLRSVFEHVSHYNAVILRLRSIKVPHHFEVARKTLDEAEDFLVKKIYGTRIDWNAFHDPDVDERIDKNKLKYQKGEKDMDRSADQVLNAIDGLSKEIKGTRAVYEILCEFAHPNFGMLLACTEFAEYREDDNGVQWVQKRLGLGQPCALTENTVCPLARILQQSAQCLSHYESLRGDGAHEHEKLLQLAQMVVRELLSKRQRLIGPYAPCPCGSGKKLRFCCGRK